MIDTGGTIKNSQVALAAKGAVNRYIYAAHGIFSNGGLERLFKAKISGKDMSAAERLIGKSGLKNIFAASAGGHNAPAVSKLVVADTINISDKLEALASRYGRKGVEARIEQLSVGAMLYDHISGTVAAHPLMKPKM